jgi:hypothetical protein
MRASTSRLSGLEGHELDVLHGCAAALAQRRIKMIQLE